MLAPTSISVLVLLLGGSAVLLYLVATAWHVTVKISAGIGVVVLGISTGVVAVNDYYGYYTSWAEAYAGTFGGATAAPDTIDTRQVDRSPQLPGRILSIELAGSSSHIHRRGLVYLPPQYGLARYRAVRFPVVELLHGTPGSPSNWTVEFNIASTIDTLLARRAIGPMVFVMPDISAGRSEQECLNYGTVRDETYVLRDVYNDVVHRFRVSHDRSEWAAVGYSSGGYCAANLALRHRHAFGAVASMDGYYWPDDGPAIKRLADDPSAQRANDPLAIANALPAGTVPIPQFWISAGTGSSDDLHAARTFATALERLEGVTFVAQPGARHNFYAWRDQIPSALRWVWPAIAPPQLRVEFPTGAPLRTGTVRRDVRATRRSVRHHRFDRPRVPGVGRHRRSSVDVPTPVPAGGRPADPASAAPPPKGAVVQQSLGALGSESGGSAATARAYSAATAAPNGGE